MKKRLLHHSLQKGFTALIAVLTISSIALIVAVNSSRNVAIFREMGSDSEAKLESNILAHNCLWYGLINSAFDTTYTVPLSGEKIWVMHDTCTVVSVTSAPSGDRTLRVSAEKGRARTTLDATLHFTNGIPSLVSLHEI